MLYKVIETDAFKSSINETFVYIIANFKNSKIIEDMLDEIDHASELLAIFPDMFGIFEPTYELPYIVHKFPVKDYFVFYVIDDLRKEVHFIKIIHSSRNFFNINYFK